MRNKILALLMTVTLILTTVVGVNIVSALNLPTMKVADVDGYIGESVDVTITLENNPGFSTASVKFDYDETRIELTGAELCSGFASGASVSYDNLPYLTFVKNKDTTASDFVTLTFKVLETAPLGDAEITVLYSEGDISNYAEEDVNFEIISGKVSVKRRPVAANGVTVSKKSLSIAEGSSEILTAIVMPDNCTDKTVTWKSNDDKIATVDNNGKVTAIKKGTTVITVTTTDGGFTDACTVTVACAHTSKTKTDAKIADCVSTGWEDYYTCNDCGQLFAADSLSRIDAIPTTTIDADNHKNVVNYPADPATCVHEGHDAYSKCEACNAVTSGSDRKYFGEHNYGTLITAENEIHTENELKAPVAAHYHCSVCDKYFTESKVETTIAELTGTTPSHSYGNWVNTDENQHWKECGCGNKISVANHIYDNSCDTDCNVCGHIRTINHTYSDEWSDDGTNHWHECSVCHKSKSQEGKHAGGTATCKAKAVCSVCKHEYGEYGNCNFVENAKAEYLKSEATCKSPAVYYKSCSVCGKKSNDTFEYGTVNSDNHKNTEIRNKKASTESDKGYTGDTWCFDCEKTVVTGNEIDKLEHKPTKVSEKAATVTEEGICEHYYCENCGKYYSDAEGTTEITRNETVLKKLAPEIIDGKGQSATAGEKKELTFRSNAAFSDFIRVELDGNELDSSDYTIKEGSIIVTLKQDYVATLSVGKHTLGIVSASGTAVTEFTIVAADNGSNNTLSSPKTGEEGKTAFWLCVFAFSIIGINIAFLRKKKSK